MTHFNYWTKVSGAFTLARTTFKRIIVFMEQKRRGSLTYVGVI